jgi:hypothetical protein
MIGIRLTGGLGNQMFQYAAARRLAIRHNTIVCLDLSWYDDPEKAAATGQAWRARPFQLTRLTISEPMIITAADLATEHQIVGHGLHNWSRRFPTIYSEPDYTFRSQILDLPDNSYLSGHFESERNFADVADRIRFEFRPRDGILVERVEAAIQIMRGPHRPLVAVHVRRGDFRYFAGGKYLLPAERIIDAMGQFRGCDFLVFFDETDWCREYIRVPEVAYSPFSTAIEDLLQCRYAIIM